MKQQTDKYFNYSTCLNHLVYGQAFSVCGTKKYKTPETTVASRILNVAKDSDGTLYAQVGIITSQSKQSSKDIWPDYDECIVWNVKWVTGLQILPEEFRPTGMTPSEVSVTKAIEYLLTEYSTTL